MNDVYILGGLRSFIGIKNGIYKHIPAEILGANLLKKLLKQYHINKSTDIDYIICGNGVGAGGNISRLMALEAGIDYSVPAFTLDMQCCSGLESIATASDKIATGSTDMIIAGGFESSSTQPQRAYNPNHPDYNADHNFYNTAKFIPHIHRETIMLESAELTAQKEHITKAEMDKWVLKSHALATKARKENLLTDIIVPICHSTKDEGIRPRMSQRLLDRMPFVLPTGKLITAANSCLINDGAALLILCSKQYLQKYNLRPLAKIICSTACGVNPMMSPKGAIEVTKKILAQQNLQAQDISAFEVNEAFAVIDVLFERAFPDCMDKYNIFGGALAYGHPYGVSGAMLILHLIKALNLKCGKLGCCSIAGAGGLGSSMIIERCEA